MKVGEVKGKCQQVINNETREHCGKPAIFYPGLYGVLCPEHAQSLRSELRRVWGIDKESIVIKTARRRKEENDMNRRTRETGVGWTMNCVLLGAKVGTLLKEGKEAEARSCLMNLTSEFEPEDSDYLISLIREGQKNWTTQSPL